MSWKVFTQSLALTNSGGQSANELFSPHTRRSYGGIHNKNLWLDIVRQESPCQGHGDRKNLQTTKMSKNE